MTLTIGVDIGGTKVAGGVVDHKGRILDQQRVTTPARDAAATTEAIVAVIEELRSRHDDIEAVGLGIAGFVDAERSVVYFAPNLLGWRDGPLREVVEKRVNLPVVVENDANAAAWGEARFGAGREEGFIVCVTLGTGVGGGVIVNRHLYRGGFGVAAEIGHIQMVEGGRPCGCGQRGCWEQYASGGALVREARERAEEDRPAAELLLGLGDGTPQGIAGEHVTEAAHQGDPVAIAAFNTLGHWVGQGLADLAAVLDPQVFILGGGVSEAGDVLLEPTRKAYEELLTGRGRRPLAEVVQAQLGNDAGVVGAADLARDR
ncbi:MAG TPA: ROK family glucokinase [Actinomycetes bacterium]|nr:ROK family glucokinase [Actinomycetes bacterium]